MSEQTNSESQRQALHIGLAVAAGIALIGFIVGTGRAPASVSPLPAPAEDQGSALEIAPAPTYRQLRDAPWASGDGWTADTKSLRGPSVLDPVELAGTDKDVALSSRSANRAYDGAPPTIPHAVRQDSASECMACHDEGMQIRGRIATPVSHDAFTSCTQCHVVEQGPMPGERLAPDATFTPNSFVGMASPVMGERAWSIAPPVTPHRTFMRERCMSCHGPNGRDAMRSTHPDRQSCEQCHAPSADMDQRPGMGAYVPWAPGEL